MTTTTPVESGLAAWIEAARAAEKRQQPVAAQSFDEILESQSASPATASECRCSCPGSGHVSGPAVPELNVEKEPTTPFEETCGAIGEALKGFGVDPSTLSFRRESLLCWNPNGYVVENTIWATAANGERIGFREEWAARTPEVSAAEICSQLLGVSTAQGAYRPLQEDS